MSLDVQAGQSELEPTMLDTEPTSAEVSVATDDGVYDSELDAVQPGIAPVKAAERFFAVDVLRGFALLGILAMNIVDFAWPGAAYGNPLRGGGFEGTDRAVWFFNHLVFEGKMMTIFSMLFGAGLVLMDQRAASRKASVRGVYYRRVLWLLAIGLVHAYLIWVGDILVLYAECGLFLYFFRNKSPRTLIILGISALLLLVPVVARLRRGDRLHEGRRGAGRGPGEGRHHARPDGTRSSPTSGRRISRRTSQPTPEQRAKDWDKEMAIYRGGYFGIVEHRAEPARLRSDARLPALRRASSPAVGC